MFKYLLTIKTTDNYLLAFLRRCDSKEMRAVVFKEDM
jgi:hypothetical protein